MSTQPKQHTRRRATRRQGYSQPLTFALPGPLSGPLLGLLLAMVLLGQGCSWGKQAAPQNRVDSAIGDGNWLCEAGKAADDWDCIQSEDIKPKLKALEARPPAPTKAPAAPPAIAPPPPASIDNPLIAPSLPQNAPQSAPPPAPQSLPQDPRSTAPPPPSSSSSGASGSAPTTTQKSLTTAPRQQTTEPAYADYAYRPNEPVRIIDLPENFYAAQLLAVSTKKQIEDFVVTHNLYNMSAARIEKNGQVLYVLLLGVYESKENAQQAVAAMPAKVQSMRPWVRPIEGLQNAMIRADRLAATAGLQ